MVSVLQSFGAFQTKIWSIAPFIPVEDWEGLKSQFCHTEKNLVGDRSHHFLALLLTPKGTFCAFLRNLKMMFLRKIHFFAYPILAQNSLFFGPEGPILTQNLKNIV